MRNKISKVKRTMQSIHSINIILSLLIFGPFSSDGKYDYLILYLIFDFTPHIIILLLICRSFLFGHVLDRTFLPIIHVIIVPSQFSYLPTLKKRKL